MSNIQGKVCAIVPSWNRGPDLRACLHSLLAQDYELLEIIVVDNGSADGSADMVRREFPSVRLIANDANLGASVAKNQGVAAADGEFVWFLDSDTVVENPACLSAMVEIARQHDDIGAIGGEVFVDGEGDRAMTLKTICPNGETRTQMIQAQGVHALDCDYLATCNCFMPRALVERLGGFDASYFVLSEDKELGWRLKRLGYRSVCDSRTAAVHNVSARARRGDMFRKRRNTVRFALINMGWLNVALLPALDMLYLVRRHKVSDLKRQRQSVMKHLDGPAKDIVARGNVFLSLLVVGPLYVGAMVGAYLWNFLCLPATLWTRLRRPDFIAQARALLDSARQAPLVQPRKGPLWRRVAPYLIAAAIIAALAYKMGVRDIARVLCDADMWLIAAATLFSCVANTVLGGDKWRRVVNDMGGRISFKESMFIRLGAGPIRFSLPSKSGELVKPAYLQKRHGIPFVRGASSLVLDKVFNLWGVLFFFFAGIPFFGERVPWYAVALPVAFVAGPIVFWRFRHAAYGVANRVHGKLRKLLTDLLSAFEEVKPRRQAFLLVYSVVFQATELVTCYLVCRAVGIEPTVPFHKIMVFVPVVIMFSNIPAAWSGMGLRELAMVTLLPHYGYGTPEQAFAAGLLLSTVEYIFPAAIGVPVLPAFLRALSETPSGHDAAASELTEES